MFRFDPYGGKRNEELNKEFWSIMLALVGLIFSFITAVCLINQLVADKSQAASFEAPPSEYAVTIDGVTEYFTLYADDGVYYNTDKERVFDASGDVLEIYTDGQCTGKSTNFTIRLRK